VTTAARIVIPHVDYKGVAPLLAVSGGSIACLMLGLLRGRLVHRVLVPVLAALSLATALGLSVWIWTRGVHAPIVAGAMSRDTLALGISSLCFIAGLATIPLAARSAALRESGGGEFFSLLLSSIAGMTLLASCENLIVLFVGIEVLSIPLYVLCASRIRREHSLEAGLKYLVIGSVGSATLLYGLAFIYGAAGTTSFPAIAHAIGTRVPFDDPLLLIGIALAATGLAFKASIAPFHQWTPDVYQGAPTPITTFMAVATKAAAFAIILRLFNEVLIHSHADWAPALAALAVITIVIGNAGAIPQRSLKRMLAWSGVAQAGYMLAGVVVGTRLGLEATVFYLAVYLAMNVAAFAVVVSRERVSERGDDISSLDGLGRASPWLAVAMTVAMLALAGFPATAGLWGKFYLIQAAVNGHYTWLGVIIVVGSMVSLVYYLRVVAVMWMGPVDVELPTRPPRRVKPVGGWSPEADAGAQPEVAIVAVAAAAATVFFGIVPQPLLDVAHAVGSSLPAVF
jgi:NADH-quinone oxidoreductase subunit N